MENEVIEEIKVKKPKKRIRLSGIIKDFIILILGILIILLLFMGVMNKSLFKYQTKTTKIGFEDVGELVTQTCRVTVICDNTHNRDFFNLFDIPFTESRQIFSYDVTVDASVDFSKITYTANDENNEITIKLPHAKIYKSTIDTSSFRKYLDSESWFSRIDLEKQNGALKAIEEQGIADAQANGIIEAADKNAKKLIEGFVKTNERYKDYKIIFEYIGG